MTRTLRQQQSMFSKYLGQMLVWVYEKDGWEVTLADGYRADHAGHMVNSCHYIRLAQDLNLFVDGIWQETCGPEWTAIGAFWTALDVDCRWGGNFTSKDCNHLSMAWQGSS